MILPDIINLDNIVGEGYLSTIFKDPSDLPIIYRKWIFGDGTSIEGPGLDIVYYTYYYPGEYDIALIARTDTEQYVVKKEKLVIVNELKVVPHFIIIQSFNKDTQEYWRLYIDNDFYVVFENNNFVFRSTEKIKDLGKWKFVAFDNVNQKMYLGDYSYFLREINLIRMVNTSPLVASKTKTEVAPNSSITLDELIIWNGTVDLKKYYVETRGRAGYLDNLV